MAQYRHPLVTALLGAIAAVFDKQVMARITLPGNSAHPSAVGYYGPASSVRHNRGGTAAARRAARKRRNVIRNRRAHRG